MSAHESRWFQFPSVQECAIAPPPREEGQRYDASGCGADSNNNCMGTPSSTLLVCAWERLTGRSPLHIRETCGRDNESWRPNQARLRPCCRMISFKFVARSVVDFVDFGGTFCLRSGFVPPPYHRNYLLSRKNIPICTIRANARKGSLSDDR
jgi:hypothetical protein